MVHRGLELGGSGFRLQVLTYTSHFQEYKRNIGFFPSVATYKGSSLVKLAPALSLLADLYLKYVVYIL